MKKLAGFAAGLVALLACDSSNPVAPTVPQGPGAVPGVAALSSCPVLSYVPDLKPLTSGSSSLASGGREETMRVSIRLDADGKSWLAAGSLTDRALITVAHEPGGPEEPTVSTSLGFFESAIGLPTRPVQQCQILLRRPTADETGEDPAEQCRRAMGREDQNPQETCFVASLALKPGNEIGEALITVELNGFSVSLGAIPVLDTGGKSGNGDP